MVFCCVPQCGTDSWRCDPSITFHVFPSSPDLAAKWIQQINSAVKSKHMWFPKGNPAICSKHFLSTDFKDDSDSLKPRVVPTVFGYKYIGQNPEVEEIEPYNNDNSNGKTGPLIVKIKTEDGVKDDILISGIYSQNKELEAIINEPENISTNTQSKLNSNFVYAQKNYPKSSNMGVKHQTYSNSVKNRTITTNNRLLGIQNKAIQKNKITKKPPQKRDNNDNLIEIGPNTFLKINPDIIKVNKKQTPSGNTVLQFLMDQKLASTIGADVLPKIVQGAISNIGGVTSNLMKSSSSMTASTNVVNNSHPTKEPPKNDAVVQHVVGHLVDTHVCKESCSQLQEIDDILMETDKEDQVNILDSNFLVSDDAQKDRTDPTPSYNKERNENSSRGASSSEIDTANLTKQNSELSISGEKADSTCIAKAPVLLTTNMSLAHCFMEKTKYLSHLRQKTRQIASLKQKVSNLNKKIEELEDKCIVQERQLSFSFLKRLRTIRKNASKGDPPATYILEQIRAYTGQKQMRWSDSTLHQCAIWCRKAPYAYEYFKKADFFKLPCLGTVKRYMRKHPEMTFTSKTSSNPGGEEEDSSSDFDFDEEESLDEQDKESKDDHGEPVMCEAVLSEEASNSGHDQQPSYANNPTMDHPDGESSVAADGTMEVVLQHEAAPTRNGGSVRNVKIENGSEVSSFPVAVDGTNLEVQELILPSGEVVQCYSSNLCNGTEAGNQYYIIPSAGDQGSSIDHEYSIVQSAESVPVILQNLDSSQMHQEQLIFITNSSDQVECTETEVITAR